MRSILTGFAFVALTFGAGGAEAATIVQTGYETSHGTNSNHFGTFRASLGTLNAVTASVSGGTWGNYRLVPTRFDPSDPNPQSTALISTSSSAIFGFAKKTDFYPYTSTTVPGALAVLQSGSAVISTTDSSVRLASSGVGTFQFGADRLQDFVGSLDPYAQPSYISFSGTGATFGPTVLQVLSGSPDVMIAPVISEPGGYSYSFTLTYDYTPFASAVPEPASWAMMVGGFGLVGACARRRHSLALA